MTYQQRLRRVALIKAIVGTAFLIIVALTLRHPISLLVSLADLALIPLFVWLAGRSPRVAAYGLVLETALALTPRQFVQGYVNGVNWPIYIVLPLIAGYVLRDGRAVLIGAVLTSLTAIPAMLLAALTLPASATRTDMLSLAAFVIGLLLATALTVRDLVRSP